MQIKYRDSLTNVFFTRFNIDQCLCLTLPLAFASFKNILLGLNIDKQK